MSESTPFGAAGNGTASLPNDIDPRFDAAASGTEPPRADPATAAAASAQEQFAEIAQSCRSWVREKPLQAIGIAAGVGFLLGRSGR